MDNDRLEILGQVAAWYYEDNVDQTVIAERIGKSRSMVSRMLQEAREQGLVEIRVTYPLKRDTEVENQLCEMFDLAEAWVLANPPVNDRTTLLRRLGRLGSRCLQAKLHNNIKIGIGWGASLHQFVRAMPSVRLDNALVIQIVGAAGHSDPMMDGTELARLLAQKLNAGHRFLAAPLFVENEMIAQSLLQELSITETLALARQVDINLVGIGAIESRLSSLYRTGYFNESDMQKFKQTGVVGDIMGRLIDAYGNPVDLFANRCIIGLELKALRNTPMVIAVAADVVKAPAILAALRGHYINTLITDSLTALKVFELNRGDNH
ncbi:MAG: sugar-binding transcriptional regulator [Anaerolineae bacterium]|nr:sugar-binding transcriptional regulator [Anaerolineae bacterium]